MKFAIKEVFCPKFFACLRGYNKSTFVSDTMAGVTVGVVAIPLAIAFGIASGVGPAEGLITAIIAGFLISLFGGSKVQIGGPTGAFIVIVYGIIQNYGVAGLGIATIMAGILLLLMGIFKLGNIIKFVPYPVVVGFTAGIALTIFSTQINDLFGLRIADVPAHFIDKWVCYFHNSSQVNFWELGVGVASLAVIILTPKIWKKVPGSLVAIVVITFAVWAIKHFLHVGDIRTISDLYQLPSGIPAPKLPQLELPEGETFFSMVRELFPSAFTIAMLGAIESLLSAIVADGVIGDTHNSNTELIGQGIANIVTPFFGGIPATGAIARTMTNINNGGRTPVAGLVHVVILLLVLLFLGTLIGYIPMACLAGVLIVVAYNMSGWRTVVSLSKNPKSDFVVMLVTFILTVVFDLTIAIEVGLLLAIVLFLKRTNEATSIKVFHNEIDPNQELDITVHEEKLTIADGVEVYEIDGPYFFGIANKFDDIMKVVGKTPKVRVIRMRKVPFVDSTGLHNLENLCRQSQREGIAVVLSGVKPSVRATLVKAEIDKLIGESNICPNINVALERANSLISSK